jgi:hypothetical protein
MALIGNGNGFKTVVAMAVTTILLTLPLLFLELHSPGLTLSQRADSSLAPVELKIDHRQQTLKVSTILSTEVPTDFPLVIHVRLMGMGGVTLAEFFTREFSRGTNHPGVIHVTGPLQTPLKTAVQATLELRLYREKSLLLTVTGHLRPPQTNLSDVQQQKPAVD